METVESLMRYFPSLFYSRAWTCTQSLSYPDSILLTCHPTLTHILNPNLLDTRLLAVLFLMVSYRALKKRTCFAELIHVRCSQPEFVCLISQNNIKASLDNVHTCIFWLILKVIPLTPHPPQKKLTNCEKNHLSWCALLKSWHLISWY